MIAPERLPEPLEIALSFTAILEDLGVRHLAGGSLASSLHGEPRSTNDVDILADIQERHVEPLIERLGAAYYASAPAMREAIRAGGSFNLIHMSAAVKVDVFVAGPDPFNLGSAWDEGLVPLREEIRQRRDWLAAS